MVITYVPSLSSSKIFTIKENYAKYSNIEMLEFLYCFKTQRFIIKNKRDLLHIYIFSMLLLCLQFLLCGK